MRRTTQHDFSVTVWWRLVEKLQRSGEVLIGTATTPVHEHPGYHGKQNDSFLVNHLPDFCFESSGSSTWQWGLLLFVLCSRCNFLSILYQPKDFPYIVRTFLR
jgi:hypothetical protein